MEAIMGIAAGCIAAAAAQLWCARHDKVLLDEDEKVLRSTELPEQWVAQVAEGVSTARSAPSTVIELGRRGLIDAAVAETAASDDYSRRYSMMTRAGKPAWRLWAAPMAVACGFVGAFTGNALLAVSAAFACGSAAIDARERSVSPTACLLTAVTAWVGRGLKASHLAAAVCILLALFALFRAAATRLGGLFGTGDVILMASTAAACGSMSSLFVFSIVLATELSAALIYMKATSRDTKIALAAWLILPHLVACFVS